MTGAKPSTRAPVESDLPEGWAWAAAREVTETVPNVKPEAQPERMFGYVDISSICNKTFRIVDAKLFEGKGAPSRARRPIRPGDVLFSNVRTYLRNVALVPNGLDAQLCSTGFTVLRSNGAIDPSLLFYQVLTDRFIQLVTPQQTGSQYPAISYRVVTSATIPLPPPAEQKRIVKKVGQLLAQANASRERLARVPAILRRFRRAVLAAACSGRLTEDWREKHLDVDPACRLIAQVRVDRRTDWEAAELTKIWSKGGTRKSDKWKDKYIEPEDPETDDAPDLPDTWCSTGIEVLLSTARRGIKTGPFGSSLKKVEHQASGTPVLGIENIGELTFIEGSKIHVSKTKAEELAEFDALPGDILISRSGTVGEVCVVPPGLGEARISTNIMRVTLREGSMLPTYFCYLFSGSPFVLHQVSQLCGGSTRDFLNQNILRSILFPLPPIEEQHEIVRRVETLFKLAETIEKRVEAATKRADKLTQAILAKAFRGELVPTEAELARREGRAYEPASALLEHIRSRREGKSAPER